MGVNNEAYNTNNSGSFSITDTLCSLAIELRELKSVVKELWLKEVAEQTQLPAEIIEPIVRERFKKKRLGRPLLEGEIRHAFSKANTMRGAADYLGVTPTTLKKYCRLYDEHKAVGGSQFLSDGDTAPPLWHPTRGTKVIK